MITWPDLQLPPINLWTMPRLGGPEVSRDDSNVENESEKS